MAQLSSGARGDLPDSAFAYVEPGHAVNGKTPDKYRHYPIHDKAHVTAALRLRNSPFWDKAKAKVMAAAKKHGIQHDADDSGRSLESLFPEVRFIADRPEIRSAGEDEPRHIIGYAAVFNSTSRRLGGFHEQVMPGAFDATLRAIEDRSHQDVPFNVVCRYNHKDDMVLGTTHAGTLKLAVDDRGLKYDVIPPACRADVMEYVDRGDVRYSSFAFRVLEPGTDDTWGESEFGLPLRQLHNVQVADTAPVMDPAYFATSASGRGMNGAIESLASWVGGDLAEVRGILEAGQASKFFRSTRRSGTQVIPKPADERAETRVLDDPATSVRSAGYAEPEPVTGDSMVSEDERQIRDEDEIRAAVKPRTTDQLCMRYHHGEPCVRPAGHPADGDNAAEGGHAGLCWGRHDGLPCNQHMGHEGGHTPVTVASRDGGDADGEPEKQDEPEQPRTDSPAEAMARMFARKKTLTPLPELEGLPGPVHGALPAR
jgi:Escherichia/Staphylococcus phage prohead protease